LSEDMTISEVRYDAPADALADVRAAVVELSEVLWAAKGPADLLAANAEIERLRSTIASVQLQVAAEIEASDAQRSEGWASARDYLTETAGARRGHGRRLTRTAKALTTDRRATWAVLRDGEVSPEHADVIVRVIALLPTDAALRDRAELFLIEQAAVLNATELKIAGDHLLEVLDPEGTARRDERNLAKHERSAHLDRTLQIIDDGIGGVRIRGRGTVEDAAVVKAALQSLAAPAAAELANTDPDCGDSGRDLRDHGARMWDALVDACQRLTDAEVLPADHGAKPRVMVLVDLDRLETGVGTAVLDTGDRLSAAAVRKLACDADLIPVVLGTEGEVLDVGRTNRLVTAAIWKALVARDRHCRFPGCRRQPIACDAHHLRHWADGGVTALDNLVLLCRAHHTVIHTSAWQVRLSSHDRHPEFKPPPRGRLASRAGISQRVELGEDGWIRERRPRE
jgi:hypothetical protein